MTSTTELVNSIFYKLSNEERNELLDILCREHPEIVKKYAKNILAQRPKKPSLVTIDDIYYTIIKKYNTEFLNFIKSDDRMKMTSLTIPDETIDKEDVGEFFTDHIEKIINKHWWEYDIKSRKLYECESGFDHSDFDKDDVSTFDLRIKELRYKSCDVCVEYFNSHLDEYNDKNKIRMFMNKIIDMLCVYYKV